eukprot:16795-Pelagomonas_calceolata.AAC.4
MSVLGEEGCQCTVIGSKVCIAPSQTAVGLKHALTAKTSSLHLHGGVILLQKRRCCGAHSPSFPHPKPRSSVSEIHRLAHSRTLTAPRE